jgi:hypothetical protein
LICIKAAPPLSPHDGPTSGEAAMYSLYRRTRTENATKYELIEKSVSLFGCNEGYVPWLLWLKLKADDTEPFHWHVDVLSELDAQEDHRSRTLIIDLKPKQNKTNVSLYEVTDVWGVSDSGWTPLLLRLRALFVDGNPTDIDRDNFIRSDDEVDEPIYEFLYTVGSVKNGQLADKWVAPPASPTNAALLWPETLNYFVRCIRERDPGILDPASPAAVAAE